MLSSVSAASFTLVLLSCKNQVNLLLSTDLYVKSARYFLKKKFGDVLYLPRKEQNQPLTDPTYLVFDIIKELNPLCPTNLQIFKDNTTKSKIYFNSKNFINPT